MSYFSYDGTLYEITEISPVDEMGFHFECWDLTPGSGGELGKIIVPESGIGDGEQIQIRLIREVPAQVLLRWMYFVPELEAHGINPGLYSRAVRRDYRAQDQLMPRYQNLSPLADSPSIS